VRYPEERRGIVIRDSKKMTFLQRTRSFEALCQRGCNAIVFKSHEEIDQANVLRATLSAMHECVVACLSQIPQDVRVVILIDGDQMIAPTDDPRILHRTCVTKGDDLCYSIAAASILAKHARDMFMIEYPDELYGFSKNKGYGTRGHLQAIREHGPCAIHRMSFRPFSNPHDGFLEDD
jgi:ribonuclease HII